MQEVTLLHRLADVVGNRVVSAKSLGGEIAYANRPHTGVPEIGRSACAISLAAKVARDR